MKFNQIIMIIILCIFYIAYFTKIILQRKKGIITNQMGKGKKQARTLFVERILRFTTFAIVAIELGSIGLNTHLIKSSPFINVGIVLAALGVFVFITAMITMKDSWRAGIPENETTKLIKSGIYKFSRNPAFLGFDLMYIGTFIAFANIVHLIFILLTIFIMHLQILEEEKFLPSVFGDEYLEYKKKTGRYFIF